MRPHGPAHASKPRTSRYIVRTTDVLQDMRVNVYEESSDKVIWYKERFLGDNEIIEQLVHNQTNKVCWAIHRPQRGWYIRIRSPMFPPGVFIPLAPVPQESPYHAEAALSFNSRTHPTPPTPSSPDGPQPHQSLALEDSSEPTVHSYPPTPTASVTHLEISSSNRTSRHAQNQAQVAQSQITQFMLTPSSVPPAPSTNAQQSFFSRALSVIKSHRSSHSNSFTLSRVLFSAPLSPPPPYAPNLPGEAAQSTLALAPSAPSLHSPLLTFHDQTPVLMVRSLTGLLEVDNEEQLLLGVDTSFWIAIALTYLEFLEERESYLAAAND